MRVLALAAVCAVGAGGALAGLRAVSGAGASGLRALDSAAPSSRAAVVVEWPRPGESLVAVARGRLRVAPRPGARPEFALSARTVGAERRTLLVLGRRGGWVEVGLPLRPNGRRGWIRAGEVTLLRDPWSVRVSLRAHRLTVRNGTRVVLSALVAAGTAVTPTPRGRFFVTELLRQPDPGGVYGPWVFVLSGFSLVLEHFRGGHGELGIHGTNAPRLLGRDVSHGCIRVDDAMITALARRLPLGTPVSIGR